MKNLQIIIILLLLVIIGSIFYHHQEFKKTNILLTGEFPELTDIDFGLSLKCENKKFQPLSIDLKNRYSILSKLSIAKDSIKKTFTIDTMFFKTFQAKNQWGINIKSIDHNTNVEGNGFSIDHLFTIELEHSTSPTNDLTTLIKNIDFTVGESYFVKIKGIKGYETIYNSTRDSIVPPFICQGTIR